MPRPPTIFVAVASYRDPECPSTLREIFAKAARPERISVGLCWQHGEQCEPVTGPPPEHAGRVRADIVPATESGGACWARSRAHALRHDEQYVLQIDSHMRFHPGWDMQMLAVLKRCPSPKPVLTTYPAIYETTGLLECNTPHLTANRFDNNDVLTFVAHNHALTAPKPGAFIAGGFIFAPAALFDEVPYDPQMYFLGEEISYSARAWTRGWDPFSPDVCLVHHLYERKGMPRHWSDNKDWNAKNARSLRRVRALVGSVPTDDADVTAGLDGVMGLGAARTLEDYSAYCGVDFRARTIAEHGKTGAFPPAPRPAPAAPAPASASASAPAQRRHP